MQSNSSWLAGFPFLSIPPSHSIVETLILLHVSPYSPNDGMCPCPTPRALTFPISTLCRLWIPLWGRHWLLSESRLIASSKTKVWLPSFWLSILWNTQETWFLLGLWVFLKISTGLSSYSERPCAMRTESSFPLQTLKHTLQGFLFL